MTERLLPSPDDTGSNPDRRTHIDRISDWPNGFWSTWTYLFKHTKCTPFVKPCGFGQSEIRSIRCLPSRHWLFKQTSPNGFWAGLTLLVCLLLPASVVHARALVVDEGHGSGFAVGGLELALIVVCLAVSAAHGRVHIRAKWGTPEVGWRY